MENIIDAVSYEENIIQLQLRNVPKHPMIIAKIFTILSECGVNVDMISQVMIEDAMQIEITLDEKYQKNLTHLRIPKCGCLFFRGISVTDGRAV